MKCLDRAFFGCLLLVLFASSAVTAQTNISGTINGDSTVVWNLAGSPYIITGSTTISTLDTVQVENGVEVRFNDGTQLTVTGALLADGASFTANTGTSRESWNRIYANSAGSFIDLSNTTIQFATDALQIAAGNVRLDTVTISDSRFGLNVSQGSTTVINGSTITGNEYPIYYSSEGTIIYEGVNDFSGNDVDAVFLGISSIIDVNWTLQNPGIPHISTSSRYVSSGSTLTIEAGNIFKFGQNVELYTQNGGTIIADGTPADPIYFTSNRNDNIGGDTNDDGTSTSPSNNDWRGIRVLGNSSNSFFDNVNVSFAGLQSGITDYRGGITLIDNDSEINSSVFVNNLYGIVLRDSSDAVITNNSIGSSGVVPVALTFDSSPVFTNNEFSSSNNQYDAIGMIGTTISGTNVLPQRDFTSIPNVTYLLLSELVVSTGSSLTIEEGVVIKALDNRGLQIRGTLISDGTAADPIVFTSVKDDNFGNPNDTNKDGNNTVPLSGNWDGLFFGQDSDGSVVDFNIIRYADNGRRNLAYNELNDRTIIAGAIGMYDSDMTITNNEISNSTYYSVDARGVSQPAISDNSFSNTGSVPVALDLSSDPTFSGNTLANVGLIALGYHGGTLNNDGIVRNRDFAGYSDITTVLLESATIASGTSLTIEPGTVVKVANNETYTLRVEGALISAGTADSVIYFTSILDDQVGNPLDTNGDGGSTSPEPDDWGAIRFTGTSDDGVSEVSRTELRYGKHGVIFTDAAPTIENVTVLSCQYYGFGIESGSTVQISDATIQNCGFDPVAISSNSSPSFSNITFNSNGSNGVNLLESNYMISNGGVNRSNVFFDTRSVVNSDATLTPYAFAGYTNIPFIFRYRWEVGTDVTLSVAPSVVFKGDHQVFIDGALRVLGTEAEPVIFTSLNDDSAGGDTNNDGNNTVPAPGQSAEINFRASAIDSLSLINNAEFRYPSNAIIFTNADAEIDSSLFQLTNDHAIEIVGSSAPEITNNRFENIGSSTAAQRRNSIYMDMFSDPVFSNNVESNVSLRGLGIRPGTWGSDATLPFRSFAGTDSITYVMHGNINIPSGSRIVIPGGMTFKKYTRYGTSRSNFDVFTVNGALKVLGTSTDQVVFTSDTDDSYGQPADLYTDGQVNDTYRGGDWITYNATSDDTSNTIDYSVFKFADVGIVANSANPTINNSLFENTRYGIALTGVSEPFVENNTFNDLNFTPMLISLVSYPQIVSGNVMSGSTYRAIGVRQETLVQDVTLTKRTFAGKVGIPYFYTGNYTVGTGAVLTIAPGVINKFNSNSRMSAQKGMIAQGGSTPDSMVVFTSIRDDFYGGDTNQDSSATVANVNDWYGIRYEGTALPAESILDYVIVKYARGGTTYAGVLADNSSPTITNSILANNGRGLQVYGSGNPVINNSDIYDNTEFGVFNRDETFTIDATNNWWGDNSGPTHSGNPGGTGDVVSDAVNYGSFTGSGATNPVLGDVSLNGAVQSFDASGILRHVAAIELLNATQLTVADVSGNSSVSAMDASLILQYVVGIIEAFPAELNSKARDQMNTYEGTENMVLSFGEFVENADGSFSVPLEISEVSELYALQIGLRFNSEAVELLGVETTSLLDGALTAENTTEEGVVSVVMATAEAIIQNGAVAELTFKAKRNGADPGLTIELFEANEKDLTANATNNESEDLSVPDEFSLYQNYPNPFNPTTTIGFDIPENNTIVRLEIYNILGQRVKSLVNDVYSAGRHSVRWDGTNDAGGQVSTGVYLYRIQAGNIVQSKKLTFIK